MSSAPENDATAITKEQFMKLVEGFWQWTENRPRRRSMWLLSLEDWAKQEYERAHRKEQDATPMQMADYRLARVEDEVSISDGVSSATFNAATGERIRGPLKLPASEVLYMIWRQRQSPRYSEQTLRAEWARTHGE